MPSTTKQEFKASVSAAKLAFPLWRIIGITSWQQVVFQMERIICVDMDIRGLKLVQQVREIASLQMEELVYNVSNRINFTINQVGVCPGLCSFNFPAIIHLWSFPLAFLHSKRIYSRTYYARSLLPSCSELWDFLYQPKKNDSLANILVRMIGTQFMISGFHLIGVLMLLLSLWRAFTLFSSGLYGVKIFLPTVGDNFAISLL